MRVPPMERKIELLAENFTRRIDIIFSETYFPVNYELRSSPVRYDMAEKLKILSGKSLKELNINSLRLIFQEDLDIVPFVIDELTAKYLTPTFLKCGIQALITGDIFSESFERFLCFSSDIEPNRDFNSEKYLKELGYDEVSCIIDYISIARNPGLLRTDPSSFQGNKPRAALEYWINKFTYRALE